MCIFRDNLCDGVPDCDNGSDEWDEECVDYYDQENWDLKIGEKMDIITEEEELLEGKSISCDFVGVFTESVNLFVNFRDLSDNMIEELKDGDLVGLYKLKELDLAKNFLNDTPVDAFSNMSNLLYLDLSGNEIRLLKKGLLQGQSSLKTLYINWNNPLEIEYGAFDSLHNLESLHLLDNGITHIRSGMFRNLNKLTELDMERNLILSIKKYDLEGLTNLTHLKLKNNTIRRIEIGVFDHTPKLTKLLLSLNNLPAVDDGVFSPLEELDILDLSNNEIKEIQAGSLSKSEQLGLLLLSGNKLSIIRREMFTSLSRVTNLDLLNNQITSMKPDCFDELTSIVTLDLRENRFTALPRGIFDKLDTLDWVYFDYFSMCGYAPTVRHCSPKGDGISSIENLLDNVILRVMVWVVAMLAFLGNLFVLIARFIIKEENHVHSFFIMNLSCADLLMGIYLFIIAFRDVIYRGEYIKFDLAWRLSSVCQFCGFLSLVSSEASVFILTIITLDRFFSVAYPFKFKKRSIKLAICLMVVIWLICICLGILPILQPIQYFGEFFYGGNGVCLPLHIDDPKANGWEFSLLIFVCVNFTAFLFILCAYIVMFHKIRRSRTNLRSTKESQDLILLKRFSLIVATDFMCWMPIIIVKFVSLAGMGINESVYAWIAIFVLPVNSALNPILYTMTTKMFKQQMLRLLTFCSGGRSEDSLSASKNSRTTRLSSIGSRLGMSSRRNVRLNMKNSKSTSSMRTIIRESNSPVTKTGKRLRRDLSCPERIIPPNGFVCCHVK
ncbi:uncharacterized protein LOC144433352 [Glandiceps talaboti]